MSSVLRPPYDEAFVVHPTVAHFVLPITYCLQRVIYTLSKWSRFRVLELLLLMLLLLPHLKG